MKPTLPKPEKTRIPRRWSVAGRLGYLLLTTLFSMPCLPSSAATTKPIWTFSVVVAVEKRTATYYEQAYGKPIDQIVREQIATVNANFNRGLAFNGVYTFQVDSIYVFSGAASTEVFRPHPHFNYNLVIDGKFTEPTVGGGWYGSNQTIYHSWNWDFFDGTFAQFATDGLTHEFGHARGGVDIYGMRVEGSKNPINNNTFEPVSSIMNYPYGNITWDEYTTNLLNSTAAGPIVGEEWITKPFPKTMGIKTTDSRGLPLANVTLELYPVEWFSYAVSANPVVSSTTNEQGQYLFATNPYQPSTSGYPWTMRYSNFLIKATYGSVIVYRWMPLYEVQNAYFKNGGDAVYQMDIQLPVEASRIQLTYVSDSIFCPRAPMQVSFEVSGAFAPDNTFRVDVIDKNNNSFINKIITGNTGATIISFVPDVGSADYKYRVRVASTKPVVYSNEYLITIKYAPPATATYNTTLCQYAAAPDLPVTGQNLRWYTSYQDTVGSVITPRISTILSGITNFYVTQTVDGCEGSRSMVRVTVKPQPPAPGVASGEICQFTKPASVSATGEGLRWFAQDGTALPVAPVIATDKAAAFTYQVAQTVAGCEGPKATLSVNVLTTPAPVVAQPVVELCKGSPAQPLAAVGTNLTWKLPMGTVTSTAPVPPTTTPTAGDLYYVTQTGANTCESPPVAIRVVVRETPTLTVGGSVTTNLGLEVPLTLKFSGIGPYQYRLSNGLAGVATQDTTIRVMPTHTTTYEVAGVTNRCGAGQPNPAASATITVLQPDIQTLALTATSVCVGGSLSVAFSTTGAFNPGSVFVLQMARSTTDSTQLNFTDIPASVPANGQISGLVSATTVPGTYRVRVVATNPNIPVNGTSSPSLLSIRPLPTAVMAGNQAIYQGESASLTVAFTGDAPWMFTYRDSSGTGLGTGQVVQSVSNPHRLRVDPRETTAYFLTNVSNVCGSTIPTQTRVIVTVNLPLGLDDQLLSEAVDVYPIPATTTLTVRIRGLSGKQTAQIDLLDVRGQVTWQQETQRETSSLPLYQYPAGQYVLRIQVGDRSVSRRIVKL